jgi:hypothetical protein
MLFLFCQQPASFACVFFLDITQADLGLYLKELASHQLAHGLPFSSFFIVPIQRLARYPLLLDAIARNTDHEHPDASTTAIALEACFLCWLLV